MHIDHAYFSRISSEEVLDKANIVANKGADINITWNQFLVNNPNAKRKIIPVADLILKKQRNMLSHVIRTPDQDPIRQATIGEDLKRPSTNYKRVGRPRQKWLDDTIERTFSEMHGFDYDHTNIDHQILLISSALNREI